MWHVYTGYCLTPVYRRLTLVYRRLSCACIQETVIHVCTEDYPTSDCLVLLLYIVMPKRTRRSLSVACLNEAAETVSTLQVHSEQLAVPLHCMKCVVCQICKHSSISL